jgi:hypothetical protein
VFYANLCHGNFDDSLGDPGDPLVASECCKPLGHRFKQALSRDIDGVSYTLEVTDGYAATTPGHRWHGIIFAFYSLPRFCGNRSTMISLCCVPELEQKPSGMEQRADEF